MLSTLCRLTSLVTAAVLCACASTVALDAPAGSTSDPLQQLASGVAVDAQDPLQALMAAELLLQQGHYADAARLYAQAAQASDDPEVAERAAQVAFYAEDNESAALALTRWRELDPDAEGSLMMQATVLLRSGQIDQAMQPLMRLFAEDQGWRRVGQAILAQGDAERALGVLARLSLEPEVMASRPAMVGYSQLAAQFGDGTLARLMADQAVNSFADDSEAWQWHGQLAEAQQDPGIAEASYQRALQLDPENTSLRVAYAGLLHDRGETRRGYQVLSEASDQKAVLAARFALAVAADDKDLMRELRDEVLTLGSALEPSQHLLIGQLSELLEEFPTALEHYRQVPESSTAVADAALRSAVVLGRMDRLDEARSALAQRREQPGLDSEALADSFLLEAELLREAGRYQEAFDVCSQGLNRLSDEPRLLYSRGLLAERLDQLDVVERDFLRLIELDPEDGHALNALGYTLADRTDRYQEAYDYIQRALELLPEEPAVLDSMGWVKYRLGELDEAESYLRRALSLQADGEIAAHLGEVLFQLGREDEARSVWSEALQADPQSAPLLRTLERLAPSLLP